MFSSISAIRKSRHLWELDPLGKKYHQDQFTTSPFHPRTLAPEKAVPSFESSPDLPSRVSPGLAKYYSMFREWLLKLVPEDSG